MQQATVNLFADMGVRPATLQTGLVSATPSMDERAPESSITWPGEGGELSAGRHLVRGTAFDTGGGVVSAVEVSVDGGESWHPASGRKDWSYEWNVSPGARATTIRSRAVDDSGNLETPGPGVRLRVRSN